MCIRDRIVTILNMLVGFLSTDEQKLRLLRSMGASRGQILRKLVLPANFPALFNTLRVNVGLSWVGVIMGEFLVSKAGLGYFCLLYTSPSSRAAAQVDLRSRPCLFRLN